MDQNFKALETLQRNLTIPPFHITTTPPPKKKPIQAFAFLQSLFFLSLSLCLF